MPKLLERHIRYLDEKERSFSLLQEDTTLEKDGWRTYYFADFSELHAYLHFDADFAAHEDRYDSKEDKKVARTELRLALSHLFRSCGTGVGLIEPHARELWNHFVWLAIDPHRVRDAERRARATVENLPSPLQLALRVLAEGGEVDEATLAALSKVIEDSFADLVADVVQAVESLEEATRELDVVKHRIATSVRPVCVAENLSYGDIVTVNNSDLQMAFSRFSRAPFQSYRDAEAIVILRNLNLALRETRARAILVTRDSQIWEVLRSLEKFSEFKWPSATSFLRRPEFMFLHLLAHVTPAEESAMWITEASDTVKHLKTLATSLASNDNTAPETFAESARQLFSNAREHWKKHVNLRLANVASADNHGGPFHWISPVRENLETESRSAAIRDRVEKLRGVYVFVQSERYREQRMSAARVAWASFLSEGEWARFLDLFSATEANAVRELICERLERAGEPGVVLRTTSPGMIASLRFQSRWYATAFAGLMRSAKDIHGTHEDAKTIILKAVAIILGRRTEQPEPEGLLFISLVLTTLARWSLADSCASRALELPGAADSHSEAKYVRAVCNRMMSLSVPGHRDRALREAFSLVQNARADRAIRQLESPEDPRYLKEMAIIIMLHCAQSPRTTTRSVSSRVPDPSVSLERTDLSMALDCIQAGLYFSEGDKRLTAELLNASVYYHSLPTVHNFDAARRRLSELEALLSADADADPTIPRLDEPAYRFTKYMFVATESDANGDKHTLDDATAAILALLERPDLTATERAFFAERFALLGRAG